MLYHVLSNSPISQRFQNSNMVSKHETHTHFSESNMNYSFEYLERRLDKNLITLIKKLSGSIIQFITIFG